MLIGADRARSSPEEIRMSWYAFQRQSLKTRVTLFTLAIFVIGNWALA